MDARNIGKRLRALRGDKSAAQVAEKVGVSTSAMLMYENGERTPRDGVKVRLSQLYGVSVGSLFFDE